MIMPPWSSKLVLFWVLLTAQLCTSNGTPQLAQHPFIGPQAPSELPNVVFILTDDQDLHMDSLLYMPQLKKHLLDKGTYYQRHYCTIALCCPSRVSLWTGKAAHNTNVTDVNPPYGGYPKFISQGLNEAWLPVWLQDAGYATYYTGKLFNAHTVDNYNSPHPKGFTGSDFLLDPHTYEYLNASFQRNFDPPVRHEGEYSTDLIAQKAYGFLDDAVVEKKPFFLTVAPNAPHSNIKHVKPIFNDTFEEDSLEVTPPIPAKRHAHLFPDVVIPRTPNFNPDEPSGVSWIAKLPKQNQTNVDYNDHFYRNRLRALQAVDEIIDGIITRLTAHGILENTYIFYSTDNGFHIGQHRLQAGKECGFEEDINIPLIVRGPGVAEGVTTDIVTSHTDLAPTFMSIIGGDLRSDFDGAAIPLTPSAIQAARSDRHEHVNIEYWGFGLGEGKYGGFYWNNTYKGLRLIGKDYNFYYSVWCSGEHELYDLNNDPYELTNLYRQNHSSIFSFTYSLHTTSLQKRNPITLSNILSRLDSLILVLKTCKSRACTHPWEILHQDGNVNDLHGALNPKFDEFYNVQQERVSFTKCEKGYILESEGPTNAKSFEEIGPRGGAQWSELV